MKLHWSPRSPFVRKVMITAHELGLSDNIELTRTSAAMSKSNPELMQDNPLSKIPCLVTSEGRPLCDSLVICEYLQIKAGGDRIIPDDPEKRILVLNEHALANNWMDMLILWRNERNKTDSKRTDEWITAFDERTTAVLDIFEQQVTHYQPEDFHLGVITLGVALAYMNFRFEDVDWSAGHPNLAAFFQQFENRPSVIHTAIDSDG